MYSRRPASMPTWASAGRTVQRGCEPRAINPLQREKRERGKFLTACDIGTKRDLFNKLEDEETSLLKLQAIRCAGRARPWCRAHAKSRQTPVSRSAAWRAHRAGRARS